MAASVSLGERALNHTRISGCHAATKREVLRQTSIFADSLHFRKEEGSWLYHSSLSL